MKAIETKYHGPGNVRGARISASDGDGHRVSIPYPHHLSREETHVAAVKAFCRKMRWSGSLMRGELKKTTVFVFVPDGTEGAIKI